MRASIKTFKRARRLRREMTAPEVVLWEALTVDQAAAGQVQGVYVDP